MLGVRNGNIASGVEAGMQRASVVPSWTPRHNEAFRIGRRMTLLERQRRESFMKGMFIPFMLLALVCSLFGDTNMFGDTNILHADVQKVVVYDSGSALTDMQKQSPVILESFEECMETVASKAPLRHLVPLMVLFMLQLGLAVSSVVRLFVRHYVPTLRKSDSWGLLPFSLAPPCFA